jgi:MGT family glycosyltransferase
MSRFLFVIVEGGGNVPPQLGIAQRLLARGHQVRVLGDRALEADVRQAGAEFVGWRTGPHQNMRDKSADPVRDWESNNPLGRLKRVADQLLFGPAEKYAHDVLEEIARFRPDALAVDFLVFGAAIAAEKSGLPTALLMHTVCQVPLEGIPPFGMGLQPGKGPLGRFRDRVLRALTRRMFDGLGLQPLNRTRVGLGLGPLAHVTDQLVRCHRGLLLTSAAFDFPSADLPSHIRYMGAPVDDPAWVAPWQSPFGAETDPLVLVALGSTFQNQQALTQRTIDALATLPARGIVTLGNVFSVGDFRAPDNVKVVASAPHNAILPHARVVVAHGGHGTVIKALAAGVPLLCIPLGRDQNDNAARVVHAKAGLQLKPSASTRAIRRALERLLAGPEFVDGAGRLRDAIAAERKSDLVIAELETLASTVLSAAA